MSEAIAAHYRHTYLGPTETFIYELLRHHSRYRPLVLTHRRRNADQFPLPDQVRVVPGPRSTWLLDAVEASATLGVLYRRAALARALDETRPDLLHAHFGDDAVVARPIARSRRLPLAVTFYGIDATRLAEHWRWRKPIRRVLREANLLLAEGPHLRQRLIDLGAPSDRVRIQPIPIRVERFDFRRPEPPVDRPPVLLQVGRFVVKKGMDLTVRAHAALASVHPETELWLVGDGPERPALERLVTEMGTRERVRFLGMLDHESYADILRRADILVQPSRTAPDGDGEGGAPTVLLEAQAVGLPVVTTRHADIPFVVDSAAALMAREDDLGVLVRHLRHLLDHPEEWPERARAGREKVIRQHDPARLARQLEGLYDALLEEVAP